MEWQRAALSSYQNGSDFPTTAGTTHSTLLSPSLSAHSAPPLNPKPSQFGEAGARPPQSLPTLHRRNPSDTTTLACTSGQYLQGQLPVGGPLQSFTSCYSASEPGDLQHPADGDEWELSPEASSGRRRGTRAGASDPRTGFMKGALERPAPNFSARTRGNAFDPAELEPKLAKRIVANRQSAHRSRLKKLQHVHELEKVVSDAAVELQDKARAAAPYAEHHAELLLQADSLRSQALALQAALAPALALQAALEEETGRLRMHHTTTHHVAPQLPGTGAGRRGGGAAPLSPNPGCGAGAAKAAPGQLSLGLQPLAGAPLSGVPPALQPSPTKVQSGAMPMSLGSHLGSLGMSVSMGSASAKLADTLLGGPEFSLGGEGHSMGLDGAFFDFGAL